MRVSLAVVAICLAQTSLAHFNFFKRYSSFSASTTSICTDSVIYVTVPGPAETTTVTHTIGIASSVPAPLSSSPAGPLQTASSSDTVSSTITLSLTTTVAQTYFSTASSPESSSYGTFSLGSSGWNSSATHPPSPGTGTVGTVTFTFVSGSGTTVTVTSGLQTAPTSAVVGNGTNTSTTSCPWESSVNATTITTVYSSSVSFSSSSALPVSANTTSTASSTPTVPFSTGGGNATSVSGPTPTPTPLHCGEYGNFTLNWDDEPSFTPANDTDFRFPPVFNPYHHFFFANGYSYVPPPKIPWQPVSKPFMAVFLPNLTTSDIGSPNAAGVNPGEIGAGPRAAIDAYWFDAFDSFIGCDKEGPGNCTMTISGWKWNEAMNDEEVAVRQEIEIPPCSGPEFMGCDMHYYKFNDDFRGLSGIQFQAFVNSTQRIFLLDNLNMAWYNNSCAAGLMRQRSRK